MSIVGEEEARAQVLDLHGRDEDIHGPPHPAHLRHWHLVERVEEAPLGGLRRALRKLDAGVREFEAYHPPVGGTPHPAEQAAGLEAVDEDGHRALVHGELPGQFAHGHRAGACQRLHRPQLGTGEPEGGLDVLGILVEGLHDVAEPLDDAIDITTPAGGGAPAGTGHYIDIHMFLNLARLRRGSTRAGRLVRAAVLQAFDRLALSESAILLAMAVVLGAATAGGVIVFYRLIDLSYQVLYRWTPEVLPLPTLLAYRPLLTGLALIVAAALMRWFARGETGLTVPDIQLRVARQGGRVPLRPTLVRTAASAITIGGGGSAGSEGPVAVLGAAFGSSLSRLLGFAASRTTVLVACGVAAGISAAFNAPLAGAFFALEEILGTLAVGAFPPVVVASVVAAVASRAVFGNHPAFPIPVEYGYALAREVVLFYPLLGVAVGVAGALFVRLYFGIGDRLAARRLPPMLVAGVGGMLVGTMAVLSGGLLLGQGHLAFDLSGMTRLAWYAIAGLAALKMLATAITLQSGGSGGLFAPSLFVGGAVGLSFGALMHTLFPHLALQPEPYALVGMGALVAAALGAPLTGILLVFEITGDYAIMLPLMVTVAISAIVARRLERDTLYSGWLRRRGERIEHGASRDLLGSMRVAEVYDAGVVSFAESETLTRMLERMSTGAQVCYPVVDEAGMLLGVVTVYDLANLARDEAVIRHLVVAGDLAGPLETVQPGDTLLAAMRRMGQRGFDAIPVVREDGKLVGLLTRAHMLAAYDRALMGEGPPLPEAPRGVRA